MRPVFAAPSSHRAPTPATSSRRPACFDLFEEIVDGVVADREQLEGQAGARHLPGRRPRRWASRRRRPACSRTRWPVWRPAGRVTSGSWSAWTGSVRRTRSRQHGADIVVKDLAELLECRDPAPRLPGRALGCPRDPSGPRAPGPDRVRVRAVQRAHRVAGQPRRGRALRTSGHVSERLLRGAPAALRRGRLRRSGVQPDRGQRDQRQDHPPARRGRAVRRSLRASCTATSGCSICAPGLLQRRAEWCSPTGRLIQVTSTRLVSFAQRAVAAILYEVEPLDGEATVVVQSELVANESMPAGGSDPRVAARFGRAPSVQVLRCRADSGSPRPYRPNRAS